MSRQRSKEERKIKGSQYLVRLLPHSANSHLVLLSLPLPPQCHYQQHHLKEGGSLEVMAKENFPAPRKNIKQKGGERNTIGASS